MLRRAAVPILLAFFAGAAFLSLRGDSATFDETAHIGAGVSYLETRDFRLNPEHPPLVKAWAALPLWLGSLASGDYRSAAWAGESPDQWIFGFELINGPLASPQRRDPARALVPARLMVLLVGIGLGFLVFAWSRALWGETGALLSLALFALSPTMLAHARLVTTDLAAAAGFAGAVLALWAHVRRPSPARAALAGVATGLALLAKFSTLLLVVTLPLCALAWVVLPDPSGRTRLRRAAIAAGSLLVIGAVAWGVVWAGYGFAWRASEVGLPWDVRAAHRHGIPASIAWAREHRLLPEAYLFGLTSALQDEVRLAYFRGEMSEIGWRTYFPLAFALKTPLAFAALALWGGVAAVRRGRGRMAAVAFLLVPLLVYGAASIGSRLNIGHRHLAPLDPFLLVLCGAVPAMATTRLRRVLVGALLAGAAVSFAAATPGYLSYANVLAGGPRGLSRYLLDSNLDWGQDLARLARWVREERGSPIALAYFGTADPDAYGIPYRKVVMMLDLRPEQPPVRPAPGEIVAVSVNLLHKLYVFPDQHLAEAVWSRGLVPLERLRAYSEMRRQSVEARRRYPPLGAWLRAQGLLTDAQVRAVSAGLLPTWMDDLRERGELVARAGDSILVLRVPPER